MKKFIKKVISKISSYGFWVSLSGAIIVLVQAIARACGSDVDQEIIQDIIMGFAGVLVVLGVVSMPTSESLTKDETDDENDEVKTDESVTQAEQDSCENDEEKK